MAHQVGQDWTVQSWTKTPPKSGAGAKKAINEAQRRGDAVDTEAKFTTGNRGSTAPVSNAKKLDEDFDTFKHETVSKDFSKALQQARLAKKMTQAQLAQAIAEKPTVVNEYESGKAIPNGAVIQKLNRALGVQLPKSKAPKAKAKKVP